VRRRGRMLLQGVATTTACRTRVCRSRSACGWRLGVRMVVVVLAARR